MWGSMDVPEEPSKALGPHPSLSVPFVMNTEMCSPDLLLRVWWDTLAATNVPFSVHFSFRVTIGGHTLPGVTHIQ